MAVQTKVVFAPEDVRAVRLLCGKCGQEVGWRTGNAVRTHETCPHCNIAWSNLGPGQFAATQDLLAALEKLAFPGKETRQFHVRMEVDSESDDDTL